jgi:chromosome segregation ATPase
MINYHFFFRKKISEISQELELKRTEFVWESIKLNDTEAKLHKCEQDKARLINDATKMRLKLNDNKEKENELQVQLDMRDKEISVLKEQLKVKIKKGKCTIDIKEDDDKELKEAQSVIGPAATVKPHSAAPKPLNLLEELQKHIETTESANTSVMKARVPLVNEENHNPNTNESPINGQQPAAGNNTPPPIATATTNRPVKILKAKDCPNQCPQQ